MAIVTTMFLFAMFALAACVILAMKLRTTSLELARVRRRMARLDEIADDVALQAVDTPAKESPVVIVDPVLAVPEPQRPRRERHNTPVERPLRRESGEFHPIGLAFDTGDVFEDDSDFAAPRMAGEARDHDTERVPFRQRFDTPAGSPRTLTPQPQGSLVSVGSISIRSDRVAND